MTIKNIRFNKKELEILEKVKEIMSLKNHFGGDSKAIKDSLRFFLENWEKTISKYEREFGETEKEFIRKYYKIVIPLRKKR